MYQCQLCKKGLLPLGAAQHDKYCNCVRGEDRDALVTACVAVRKTQTSENNRKSAALSRMRNGTSNDLQHDAVSQGLDDHHQTIHSKIDKPDADIGGYTYLENSMCSNDAETKGDREETTLHLTRLDAALLEAIPDLPEEKADVLLSAMYRYLEADKEAATMFEHGSGIEGFNRFKESLSGKEELVERLILEYDEGELYTDSSESMCSSENDEDY